MNNNPDREGVSPKEHRRFQAVVAMLKGESISQIVEKHKICRSALYKFRRRALVALREAMHDLPRGPKTPCNRIPNVQEKQIELACRRYPTMSSYKMCEKVIANPPSPRTIQRVRNKLSLQRLPKRAPARSAAKRFHPEAKESLLEFMSKKKHLGALRLSWDVANILKSTISPSTILRWRRAMAPRVSISIAITNWLYYERKHPHSLWHGDAIEFERAPDKTHCLRQLTFSDDYSRGYVYNGLTTDATASHSVRCMICAMRKWKVIPKAVLFDNGPEFRGTILKTFCKNLGIRIIYSTPNHPQTNGKLERAFRDDKRDFYGTRKGWSVEALQKDLPGYTYYRNYQRGHFVLKGKPAITRLCEQHHFALPSVLDRLEEYAVSETTPKRVDAYGYTRTFNRPLYVGTQFARSMVQCFETMEGLEMRKDGIMIGVLQDYYLYRTLFKACWDNNVPENIELHQPYPQQVDCPRIAVAV